MSSTPLRLILTRQFVLVAVIPFLVMTLLCVYWLLPQVNADIEAQHFALARAIKGQVEGHLLSAKSEVQLISTFLDKERIDHEKLSQLLDIQLKKSNTLSTLYDVDLDGHIRAVGIGQDHHENIHAALEGLDFSGNPLFFASLTGRKSIWSDTFLSIVGGHLTVAVIVPTDKTIVIGELALDNLNQFLKRSVANADQKILVIDRHGQVVADQDGIFTAQQLNISNIPLVRKGMASPAPYSGRFVLDGQEMIGAIIEIPETQWDILVADPVDVAFLPAFTITRIVVIGLLTALIVGIGTAMLVARRLFPRFEELALFAKKIAVGDEGSVLIRGGIVEVDTLAKDLLLMQQAIREREWELNESKLALIEEKNFIATTINSMLGVIFVIDTLGHVVRGNDAHRALYGADDDSYLGGDATRIIHPGDRTLVSEKMSEVFATGYGEMEARLVDASGMIRTFLLNGRRIEISGAAYIVGSGIDITGKKLIELALVESEERFRQLFEQNDDAIFLINIKTLEILDGNQAANDLFLRKHPVENGPENIATFIENRDFENIINLMNIDDFSRSFHIDRIVCKKLNGEIFFASIWLKILEVGSSHIIYCSIRDITAKLEMEEQIKSTQAKLIHTNKMTSLGLLVSSVAHEINNPNHCIAINASVLTNIWRDAAMIIDQAGSDASINIGGLPLPEALNYTPKLFNDITESSRRINSIIVNMRDFVKKGQSKDTQHVDINKPVSAAISLLWHIISRHTDNFQSNLSEGIPPALGNAQQIEQVIINLLMNALYALPDKKHHIAITTEFDRTSGHIIIKIQDDGKGMDPATLQRLTEPFFTTREEEGGTGLGIYISSMILKDCGGTMTFESEPNKGTVATVRLLAQLNSLEPL